MQIPPRSELPNEVQGIVHKTQINQTKIYIKTLEYNDGRLGGVHISLDKEGSKLRIYTQLFDFMNIGLQHGIPFSEYTKHAKYQNMEPCGITTNPKIPFAKSIVDYVARWLESRYNIDNGKRISNN